MPSCELVVGRGDHAAIEAPYGRNKCSVRITLALDLQRQHLIQRED